MAEIANTKTWTKTRLVANLSSAANNNKLLFVKIKDEMKAHGWTVVGSSDATTANLTGTDLWVDQTDITVSATVAHSWIVLTNGSIATGFQICFAFSITSTTAAKVRVVVSRVGFTGGSTTARPTATDEIICTLESDNWTANAATAEEHAHVFTSSDHQCTHVVLSSSASAVHGFWALDRPAVPPSWFTNPWVVIMHGLDPLHSNWSTSADLWANVCTPDGLGIGCGLGSLMVGTTRALTSANLAGASGDYGGNWPCTPAWLVSSSPYMGGIVGRLFDLWWGHTSLADGDAFPADGSSTQVVIGNVIQGNDGTALVL